MEWILSGDEHNFNVGERLVLKISKMGGTKIELVEVIGVDSNNITIKLGDVEQTLRKQKMINILSITKGSEIYKPEDLFRQYKDLAQMIRVKVDKIEFEDLYLVDTKQDMEQCVISVIDIRDLSIRTVTTIECYRYHNTLGLWYNMWSMYKCGLIDSNMQIQTLYYMVDGELCKSVSLPKNFEMAEVYVIPKNTGHVFRIHVSQKDNLSKINNLDNIRCINCYEKLCKENEMNVCEFSKTK